ncbi:MAG: hypothetical protein AB1696_18765 [Planctomycetota bacterium]
MKKMRRTIFGPLAPTGGQALSVIALAVVMALPVAALAQTPARPEPIKVRWMDDWRGMEFTFQDEQCCWPKDMEKATFPSPESGPEFRIETHWPVVAVRARWSVSLKDLSPAERDQILDLALMYTCDATLYHDAYPEVVLSSSCRRPTQFPAKAADPANFDLGQAMRGQIMSYQITADAGFGAPNYTINSKIRMGVSADGKSVFFQDSAESVTANLTSRDYLVCFHIADGQLRFEGRVFCVCTDRRWFRGEHMRRVAWSAEYLVTRLYEDILRQTSDGGFGAYLGRVKMDSPDLAAL